MPYHDLNIAYTTEQSALSHTLSFAQELDYETVALSISINGKIPSPLPSIALPNKPINLKLLTRLTLTISDPSQNYAVNNLSTKYDILALRPTNEKTLQHCCSSLECDLISLDFSQRLPCPLKFKTVASALQRGIRFEICYAHGIVGGNDARRNLISGATQLVRATRGRGIIVTSDAKNALGLRGPADVINLAQLWGLSQERAREAVCEEAEKVVRFACLKRSSYRGVVDIIDGGQSIAAKEKELQARTNGTASKGAAAQKGTTETSTNAAKRKASASSLKDTQVTTQGNEKPLSKSEQKRRAKKARMEGVKSSIATTDTISKTLPIQHETLMPTKPK